MNDHDSPDEPDLDDVEAQLRELRRRKQVRWTMSRQTAEMAIAALQMAQEPGSGRRRGGKARRRKRRKRLL